eukprot:TRINITY_DN25881_c0_g1_i1.p1 TRINITY_DN25881_c0_g1~~TRINITY_DN25881_c0_g1_i1.p1  ORF type:complete len:576 (-),score=114.77 TRINITY_DN25881_c0_g1_i1:43-1704(-)
METGPADNGISRVAAHRKGRLHTTIVGLSGSLKIVHYSFRKLINRGPFVSLLVKGTVFNLDKSIWINMAKHFVIFAVFAVYVWFLGGDLDAFVENSYPTVNRFVEKMQMFCPFLFGLFVSTSLSRWWALRSNGIGNAADYITNLSCFLTANAARRLVDEADWLLFKRVHGRIVRYGLAGLSCIAKESRGKTGSIDDLVELGLLVEADKVLLESVEPHARAETLWCWMSVLAAEAMEMVKLPSPNMNTLYVDIRDGMEGVHCIHQFLQTQLPFPYVHMITLLVNVHNIVVAAVAGLKFSVALQSARPAECIAQILQALIVPTMYQGLIQICMFLSDPFGDDIIDFPILEYIVEVSENTNAIVNTTRTLYQNRWGSGLSPMANSSLIRKLPKGEVVNASALQRAAQETEKPTSASVEAVQPAPASAEALKGGSQPMDLQAALLSELNVLAQTHSISSEVQQTVLKAALQEFSVSPSSKSLEQLGRWLIDVQQHIAKIPPMPKLDFKGSLPASSCPNCGNQYLDDAKFCRKCGEARPQQGLASAAGGMEAVPPPGG